MGDKTLVYKRKVESNLNESYKHLKRLNEAFNQLNIKYSFPIDENTYKNILNNIQDLAFSDQIIYDFLNFKIQWEQNYSNLCFCIKAKI